MPINNLRGKPGALQAGIDITKGNIILMTDADCTVNPNWIRKMIATYQNDKVGLTASLTNIKGNRIFDKIQAVEWIYMHTMASAGIGLGVPLGCYGNNYSVRKSDYEAVGGYKSIKFSVTEDLALLQAINNNNRQVRYLVDEGSVVDTLPCVTFGEYLKQRHRWAIGGLNLGFKAFVFVASSGAFWGGIMTALITSHIPWLIIILSVRLVCDFLLIYPTLAKIKKEALSMWVLPSIYFFTLMELIVPFLVIKKTVVWKNQVFR
jgi:cellulose synthase/poly-beta-1,6-N-acetylglucosamine synthase-like glycosyltransferase